jgi:pyrroline-5-carboxylate reductase
MRTLAIIGLGNMGAAIQELLREHFEVIGIDRQYGALEAVTQTDVIILAVKPQSFAELAKELRQYVGEQTIISIMAGVKIDAIRSTLGATRIVRTMPNLALKIGQSLTAWYTESDGVDMEMAHTILDAWGTSMRLEHEPQFDAFTALVGSGPAYFFELARQLEQVALSQGFSAEQSKQISVQTFKGAASVLQDGDSAGDWVRRVASKGGTTEAALKVLGERNFGQTIGDAVAAATKRSRELGRQ